MKLAALLLLALAASARADVSTPVPKISGSEPGERACSTREWLAIKHAAGAWCRAHPRDSACDFVTSDVKLRFCDGEHDDPDECRTHSYFRENPERCVFVGPTMAGARSVRVSPDCWSWKLSVVPRGSGFRILALSVDTGSCD